MFLLGGCGDDYFPVAASPPDAAAGDEQPDAAILPSAGQGGNSSNEPTGSLEAGVVLPDAGVVNPTSPDGSDASPIGYCGDKLRDPEAEQCDDGPGNTIDPCTTECRLRDVVFAQVDADDPDEPYLTLGSGPHPIAAGDDGFAIVYVRAVGIERSIWIARFDPWGGRLGADIEMSAGSEPSSDPDPVVAALPAGAYVVAWNDSSSGTPDVRLRAINATGSLDVLGYAHQGTSGTQQTPDLLWAGDQLVIAYSENFDIKTVILDGGLAVLNDEAPLVVSSTLDTSVALAPFGDSYAAVWRDNDAGAEWIHARFGATQWSVGPVLPLPEVDRPRVAQLDQDRLLLVFGEGADPEMTGTADVARLRWAVLDVSQPGETQSFAFDSLQMPYDQDLTIRQRQPTLAHIAGTTYVGWQSGSASQGPAEEVWWAEISSETEPDAIARSVEQLLPLTESSLKTQSQPSFAVSSLLADGALISAWESLGDTSPSQLVLGFRPVPFIE